MTDPAPTLEEIRAAAARLGIDAGDDELDGVRSFLAVFLPAIDELAGLLPAAADGAGPAPLRPE